MLAGAAASASDPGLAASGTGPFAVIDDHFENHFDDHGQPMAAPTPMGIDDSDLGSIPLAAANENGTGPNSVRARSHRAQPRRAARTRRRWPIVTTSLVVLLGVIIGGGYIAWRWSQDQYYVAADSKGQVVIYRGINQRIAGISLSRPYQRDRDPAGPGTRALPADGEGHGSGQQPE